MIDYVVIKQNKYKLSFTQIAFFLILFFFFQSKPDKRTVRHDIDKISANMSLLSRFSEKRKNNRKYKTHWYLVLLCSVLGLQSPVFSLYYYFWLKARRKERREMFL